MLSLHFHSNKLGVIRLPCLLNANNDLETLYECRSDVDSKIRMLSEPQQALLIFQTLFSALSAQPQHACSILSGTNELRSTFYTRAKSWVVMLSVLYLSSSLILPTPTMSRCSYTLLLSFLILGNISTVRSVLSQSVSHIRFSAVP